jgi:hypothetical protein
MQIDGAIQRDTIKWLHIDQESGNFYVEDAEGTSTIIKKDKQGNEIARIRGDKYSEITGYITNAYIKKFEGEEGGKKKTWDKLLLLLETEKEHQKLGIALPISREMSPYGITAKLLELFPSVDLSSPVTFIAYKKNGYQKLFLKQDDKILESIFNVWEEGAKYPTPKNGYPQKKENATDDEYADYKIEVYKFLRSTFEDDISPKFKEIPQKNEVVVPEEDINPDDIHF